MFEFDAYHLLLATLGLVVVLAYWLPRWVSGREPAASALLIGLGALAFGMVPGMPAALSPVTSPGPWERASELCVVVGLFGVGLRIDKIRSRRLWMPTFRMLAFAMPLTIFAVALLGWSAGGLTLAGALLLGAVLAPTDPVLASDVQVGPPLEGGEHPVRFTLTCEAGLNDGLAFPFVHLAIAIGIAGTVSSELLAHWLWLDVGYRIAMGTTAGVGMGWLLGKLLFEYPRDNALAKSGAGVVALAGTVAVYGVTELLEGYGFIAAFVAGLTLRRAESRHEFHTRLHDFSESIERTVTAVLLVALGAALPALLPYLGLAELVIVLGLVFVIRPAAGLISLIGSSLSRHERLLVAAYGVRGIGSIYYLAYAGTHLDLVNKEQLWAIIAATVLLSTLVHGLTAGFVVERVTGEAATPNTGA